MLKLLLLLLYFKFWDTCAGHTGLLHRYMCATVVCCTYQPGHLGFKPRMVFVPMFSFLSPLTTRQAPVCDVPVPLPVSMCSHCSIPIYEWEHAMFGFLFLCQFAENDGFQLHPCPCKGHELILFYGCIVFHGVYVPHFLYPVYHWWTFGLVPSLCYCEQCRNKCMCACVFIIEWG